MPATPTDLPIIAFTDAKALRDWLTLNHRSSAGVYVRVFKVNAGVKSVGFPELLDEGLCFGWSESTRLAFDEQSYLQRFTPRKTKGTTSARNLRHVERLIAEGRMTVWGLAALGMD